ncbi:efflux RND transporter periplasmic adaptor subunit [Myxococcota bacterium]|nr:efflux RND transporter periplasmic adaptor subunit [Myxococcota bacterium]
MMSRSLVRAIVAVSVALASIACRDEPARAVAKRAAPADGAMCKEHGVLEAVCTKCNPALIPVFQAKGDWCGEHGFPESFCPICHPEKGGKPEADVAASGDGPADGTKVRFKTKETARLAGLRFEKAIEQPTQRALSVIARVVYDGARVAEVNPRMPGVVRVIHADVGANVKAGAPLAVIESADVGAEQSRLSSAQARFEVASASYARLESLRKDGIATERELLEARQERESARAEVRAAEASLGMVGASADGAARYVVTSPLTGVVTARNATMGRLVDRSDIIFEIVDPSAMWVELDVPESELSLVAVGQPVKITLDSLPGRVLEGRLSYVAPAVDPRTRTAIARVPLKNPDGALRANVFGNAEIAVTDPRAAVLVPKAAVQRARSVSLVFVRTAEDTFEARRVKVEPGPGERVSVAGRVAAGDEVVTDGSFLLKTETLKESIGAGCCEVD